MEVKKIHNTNNYFISSLGYCFKIKDGKEIVISPNLMKGVYRVRILNQKLNLLNLMVEYFIGEVNPLYKLSYKFIDNKMPLDKIKITKTNISRVSDKNIITYKCYEKANAANSRVKHTSTITEIDVLNCLERNNYKCFYCGSEIKSNSWHLDHVYPLSLKGLNSPTNITASCKECNVMKGALPYEKFLYMCDKISKHQQTINQ